MFSANGTIPSAWTPAATSETDFTLSPILSPLADHKSDLTIVRGLDQKGGGGDGHQSGMGGMLTGQMLNAGPFAGVGAAPAGWAMGPSVDQRMAEALLAADQAAVAGAGRAGRLGRQLGAHDLPRGEPAAAAGRRSGRRVRARVFAICTPTPHCWHGCAADGSRCSTRVASQFTRLSGQAQHRRPATPGRAPHHGARDRDAPDDRPGGQQPGVPRSAASRLSRSARTICSRPSVRCRWI